jgi:hypothetical protein
MKPETPMPLSPKVTIQTSRRLKQQVSADRPAGSGKS